MQKTLQTKNLSYLFATTLLLFSLPSIGCKKECTSPPDDRTLKIVVFESGQNVVEVYNEEDFIMAQVSAINYQIPPVLEFQEDHIKARFVMDCDAKETAKYYSISVNGQFVEQLKVTIRKTSNEHCECGEMAGTITSIAAKNNSFVQVSANDHVLRIEL